MSLYPLFADLRDREVLVVGGGDVATRKVDALLRAGARVCVCSPALAPALERLRSRGALEHRPEDFDPDWLDDVWLVIAATDDPAFNAWLAGEAKRRRKLANIVDDAALSTFQVPAVVDRSPLVVAISSGGAAPMLARRLREQLETQLDHSWGALAALFHKHRVAIRERYPDLGERRRWYDAVIDSSIPALLRSGDNDAAEAALLAKLVFPSHGAGNLALIVIASDAGQLTLHALRVMNQADALFAANDLAPEVLELARRDAPRERFAHLDDLLTPRIAALMDQGQRVVVLFSDTAMAVAAGPALLSRSDGKAGVCELIRCEGSAAFL
jgi:precorrin-2 dehydrogenase / sirohydrochlorin ferrochelatase